MVTPARRRGRPPGAAGLVAGAPAHLVRFRDLAATHSLGYWAAKYLAEEVYGLQALNTLDAKSRDPSAFVHWFAEAVGEGAEEVQRPRRNRAILAVLYYTGLRVSELVALRRGQYDGRYTLRDIANPIGAAEWHAQLVATLTHDLSPALPSAFAGRTVHRQRHLTNAHSC